MSNPGYDDIVALNDSGSGNNNNNNSGYDIGAVDGNGFSTPLLTFAAVMTFLIMIVGIFGNFLTVVALIKCPKVRNVAAAFIISLCLADLLFCALVLPFSALRFLEGTWTHGSVLCRLIPFIQYGNIGVSLLCIAMITINRYVMIAHHSAYGRIYKRHWIAAMIAFCWIFSYGMQLPTLLGAWGRFDYDPRLQTCSIMSDTHGHSSKTTLFITAFIIPCLIIIACYTKIFWVVHKSEQRMKQHANKQNSIPNNLRALPTATTPTAAAPTTTGATASGVSVGVGCAGGGGGVNNDGSSSSSNSNSTSDALKQQQANSDVNSMPYPACGAKTPTQMRVKDQREVRAKRNEWRITKMVLAIFLSFVICYLPITIVKVADKNVEHPSWHIFSYIMLYLSACINPIIYVIMNKQYRKAYKTVIMCEPSRLRILPFGKSSCLRPGQGVGGNGAAGGRVGGAAGCGGTSSAAEKWKDIGLSNNNHSRTLVSQISVGLASGAADSTVSNSNSSSSSNNSHNSNNNKTSNLSAAQKQQQQQNMIALELMRPMATTKTLSTSTSTAKDQSAKAMSTQTQTPPPPSVMTAAAVAKNDRLMPMKNDMRNAQGNEVIYANITNSNQNSNNNNNSIYRESNRAIVAAPMQQQQQQQQQLPTRHHRITLVGDDIILEEEETTTPTTTTPTNSYVIMPFGDQILTTATPAAPTTTITTAAAPLPSSSQTAASPMQTSTPTPTPMMTMKMTPPSSPSMIISNYMNVVGTPRKIQYYGQNIKETQVSVDEQNATAGNSGSDSVGNSGGHEKTIPMPNKVVTTNLKNLKD